MNLSHVTGTMKFKRSGPSHVFFRGVSWVWSSFSLKYAYLHTCPPQCICFKTSRRRDLDPNRMQSKRKGMKKTEYSRLFQSDHLVGHEDGYVLITFLARGSLFIDPWLMQLIEHVCCAEVKKANFSFLILSLHYLRLVLQNNYLWKAEILAYTVIPNIVRLWQNNMKPGPRSSQMCSGFKHMRSTTSNVSQLTLCSKKLITTRNILLCILEDLGHSTW